MLSDHGSVAARPADDERHSSNATIPHLELHGPFQRLEVAQPCFGLDTDRNRSFQKAIPRTPIPGTRVTITGDGRFVGDAPHGAEPTVEIGKEREVRGVAKRWPRRVDARGEVPSKDAGYRRGLDQAKIGDSPLLNAGIGRARDSRGLGHGAL